ncbi:MAG: hypothetical protein PUB39_01705 [Eubacteriales bacterium]|nr:hypothetical protein [Eubacteriales bacterium]
MKSKFLIRPVVLIVAIVMTLLMAIPVPALAITKNVHQYDTYTGEDVWKAGSLEASAVDSVMAQYPCCSYFKGQSSGRCAEFGRKVRHQLAARSATHYYSNLKMTGKNIVKIAKGCKPGTTLSFGPKGVAYHMIVLLRVTDKSVWWVDCNWNWDNYIHYRQATPADFAKCIHWRADKATHISSITKVTKLKNFSKFKARSAYRAASGNARVVWTKVPGAKKYRVYRIVKGKRELVAETKATSFENTDSKPGRTYRYQVKAIGKFGVKWSNKAASKAVIDSPVPVISRAKRRMSWQPVEGAKSYRVYRRIGMKGKWKYIKTIKKTSYTDSKFNVKADTYKANYYRVKAVSKAGKAANSRKGPMVATTKYYCLV